jgi:hypothetical protein
VRAPIDHDWRGFAVSAAIGLVGAAMVLVGLSGILGCGSAPSVLEQAETTSYGATQLLCVAAADTKAHADSCRDQIKEYWCSPDSGPLAEAGACRDVTLSAGARP